MITEEYEETLRHSGGEGGGHDLYWVKFNAGHRTDWGRGGGGNEKRSRLSLHFLRTEASDCEDTPSLLQVKQQLFWFLVKCGAQQPWTLTTTGTTAAAKLQLTPLKEGWGGGIRVSSARAYQTNPPFGSCRIPLPKKNKNKKKTKTLSLI